MFILPTPDPDAPISSSEEEEEVSISETDSSPTKQWDLHTIDPRSKEFNALPIEMKHEILTELIATRKQSSWGRLHELPKQSDDFSLYQMKRLLKRQSVQSALDDISKEMGGNSLSLAELEELLQDQGVLKKNDSVGKRIASDETTRFLYIRDIKEALDKAKQQEAGKNIEEKQKSKADIEEEKDWQKAISLSLQEEPSTSSDRRVFFSEDYLEDIFESDLSENEEVLVETKLTSAESYMMEYSGLSRHEVQRIISRESKVEGKRCLRGRGKIQDNREGNDKGLIRKQIIQNETVNSTKSETQVRSIAIEEEDEELKKAIALSLQYNIDDIDMKNGEIKEVKSVSQQEQMKIAEDTMVVKKAEAKESFSRTGTKTSSTREEVASKKGDLEPNLSKNIGTKVQDTVKLDRSSSDGFNIVKEDLIAKESINKQDAETKSGSEDSDADDFLDVTEVRQDCIEVQIDTRQPPEEDLFRDIFSKDTKDIKPLEILINPTENPEDDLFKDVFQTSKDKEQKTEKKLQKNDNSLSKKLKQLIVDDAEKSEESKSSKASEDQRESTPKTIEPNLSIQDLQEMRDNLEQQKEDLQIEQSTKERQAINISEQMYQEAQELLELFGVPFIIAPMEAEAQCAFLDAIDLTDGTITDDSDIWLFGGKTVYKNFFNQSKYVMEFKAENIKHHFKLTREQMILLALLVGSDYTIGVSGVGPVTALEILSTFPPTSQSKEFTLTHSQLLSGLKEFKSWFCKGRSAGPGRSSLKNKLKNINFTENFPSPQVVQAYLEPAVETSKEEFSWSKPDFIGLTLYAKEKLCWSSKKTEEILNPVIKRMEEVHTQKTIKDYFKTKFKAPSDEARQKMSKRVKSAVERFGKTPEELLAEEMELLEKEKEKALKKKSTSLGESEPKRKKMKKKKDEEQVDNEKVVANEATVEDEDKTKKCAKGRKRQENAVGQKSKTTRKKSGKSGQETAEPDSTVFEKNEDNQKDSGSSTNQEESALELTEEEEIKHLENLAAEIRQRRKRKNESGSKKIDSRWKKKQPIKILEDIPENMMEDPGVQDLIATASASAKRVEQIDKEIEKQVQKLEAQQQSRTEPVTCTDQKAKESSSRISEAASSSRMRGLHTKEIIHQRLKENKDLLKNKMKAIEVFRKTKLGNVKKNPRRKMLPKEEAELSEDSD
ncbi:unnamed protein product [Acanthoscelides obtectus]|nr:unnamed protein product [Acanthoscelides obtectus]CAK1634516.1 DNA repair protein complementing XP-G cells [Acanthoscelides obtectus]